MTVSLTRFRKAQVHMDGWIHPDFKAVEATLRTILENYSGGAATCVFHQGQCVADLWGGYSDAEQTPWNEDTMAPSFSTTKGVASTLLHVFADRGAINYDARVADYWPEFGQNGKENITVRQVLSHQSGLYHIRQMIDRADRMLDWNHMIQAIEQSHPAHTPGTRTGYHGLTYGFLVGEIIQRVSGKKFSRLVQTEIAKPLGLDGMYIGAPKKEIQRAAKLIFPGSTQKLSKTSFGRYAELTASNISKMLRLVGRDSDLVSIFDALAPRGISDFDFGSPESLRVAIPAGNGLFTARSLAKMYALLANGGELEGQRLLSRKTLDVATTLQKPTGKQSVIPFDMRWRLGYHGVATTRGFPPKAFGHFGFGGSGAWADPSEELSVALIVNSGLGSPFGDMRTARIGGAALTSARRRGRQQKSTAFSPEHSTVNSQGALLSGG
ncbi:MAG: CubicO group peptidase (beta-lactamase class C family) [Halieaceae bacterium]|jgi:CubicO group peptidase (beta-lactamase class C family)